MVGWQVLLASRGQGAGHHRTACSGHGVELQSSPAWHAHGQRCRNPDASQAVFWVRMCSTTSPHPLRALFSLHLHASSDGGLTTYGIRPYKLRSRGTGARAAGTPGGRRCMCVSTAERQHPLALMLHEERARATTKTPASVLRFSKEEGPPETRGSGGNSGVLLVPGPGSLSLCLQGECGDRGQEICISRSKVSTVLASCL